MPIQLMPADRNQPFLALCIAFAVTLVCAPSAASMIPPGIATNVCTELAKDDPDPKDYILVKVCGIVKTGIVAIGGETTGTTITSSGMTWELEFADGVPEAIQSDSRYVVIGTLTMREGVERGPRMIVAVDSINEFTDEPMANEAEEAGTLTVKQIDLKRSGGFAGLTQSFVVAPNGEIKDGTGNLVGTMTAAQIRELNQLLEDTDWEAMVSEQRLNRTGADMRTNEFVIQTETDTYRFTYDDDTIRSQPNVRKLLGLIRR